VSENEDNGIVLVTEDNFMSEKERQWLTGDPEAFIPIESEEELKDLARAARRTLEAFKTAFPAQMSADEAKFVRYLRVERRYSWREVAQRAKDQFLWATWQPPNNQLAGILLCQCAAARFDEAWTRPPWN